MSIKYTFLHFCSFKNAPSSRVYY